MAENSKIEWTDHTFNPWIGCTKVSPGCANCYADTQDKFRKWTPEGWGKGKPRKRTSDAMWKNPIQWNKKPWICESCGGSSDKHYDHSCTGRKEDARHTSNVKWHRARVFCASLADWLDDEVPIEWLADLLKLIHDTPNLDWLLLTKRPENWSAKIEEARDWMRNEELEETDLSFLKAENPSEYKKAIAFQDTANWLTLWLCGSAPHNIWIGTTVEDQKRADERIPALLEIPAKVRFLSCEPLLEEVNLDLRHGCRGCNHPGNIMVHWNENGRCSLCDGTGHEPSGIHWVICGGESGPKARPMHPDWARSLRDQCKAAEVPFLFKQWGEWIPSTKSGNTVEVKCAHDFPKNPEWFEFQLGQLMARVGKKAAGRLLDGCEWNEFPNPKH